MKKISLLAGCLLITGLSFGQTDLFFSEIVEGAGSNNNDKAVEIFNPTDQPIDITQYSIRRYSNGSSSFGQEERLMATTGGSNILQPLDVWVIANPDPALHPQISSVADQISQAHGAGQGAGGVVIVGGGAVHANGNDAYELVRWEGGAPGAAGAVPVVVDIFGKKGEDPGLGGWSGLQPGTPSSISSANHSIVRKPHIYQGVTENPTVFDITEEWVAYSVSNFGNPGPDQEFSKLGSHVDYIAPLGIEENSAFANSVRMYPNPATGSVNIDFADGNASNVSVVNALGQQVSVSLNKVSAQSSVINLSNLNAGIYFVKFMSTDGKYSSVKSLIVQ